MANELFQFTIIDYTTNPSGDQYDIEEPIGWDGVEFELVRLETHGFVDRINIDGITFEFRGVARDVLTAAYELFGTEAKVELNIQWRGNPNQAFTEVYNGLFKFSTYKEYCGIDCYVSCGVVQDGFYYLFANRKEQVVDLSSLSSFDGTALTPYSWLNRDTNIPSKVMKFTNELHSVAFNEYDNDLECGLVSCTQYNAQISLEFNGNNFIQMEPQVTIGSMIMYDKQIITPNYTNLQAYIDAGGSASYIRTGENEGLLCGGTYNLTIDYNFTLNLFDGVGTGFSIQQVNVFIGRLSASGDEDILWNSALQNCVPVGTTFLLTFVGSQTQTFTLNKGDNLFVGVAMVEIESAGGILQAVLTTEIDGTFDYLLTSVSVCQDSKSKLSLVHEVLSRQVESYTNDEMRVYSEYFGRTDSEPYTYDVDGCGGKEALCNGLQVRRAQNEAQQLYSLKASFGATYNNLNAIHNLGFGQENDNIRGGSYKCIRVEGYEHFYRNDVIGNFDYARSIEKNILNENIYQGIEIGYNIWSTEEEGGREDLFASRKYNTSLTRTSNLLSIMSEFVASDFALEVTRRLYGLSKTDWRYDENVFIICMYRNVTNDILVEEGESEIEPGIPLILTSQYIFNQDTQKNSRITPVRNLMRHVSRLITFLKPSLIWTFKFKEGKANYIAGIAHNNNNCIIELNGAILAENQDLEINTFQDSARGTPFLTNEQITFEYPLNCLQWADIKAMPYGVIGYSCTDGDVKYGWIKSLKFNPTKGIATFNLINKYVP